MYVSMNVCTYLCVRAVMYVYICKYISKYIVCMCILASCLFIYLCEISIHRKNAAII